MRTIVHLSDLHFGRVDPRIESPLIEAVHEIAPDLIAVSGDFTQRARRREFLAAQGFLAELPFAKLLVPGNHDVPLYNMAARLFSPLSAYRRHLEDNLAPVFADEEMVVVGLNSARSVPFSGSGRLNERQVSQAAGQLRSASDDVVKVVVTHHPFDLPTGHHESLLIGRSEMAMVHLAEGGADLFLAGHLHVSHVGVTAARYKIAGHSAVVVQAGTMSTRGRGEPNSFNVVRLERGCIAVERLTWRRTENQFRAAWRGTFRRAADGWVPDGSSL